eukprot:GHVR01028445.1.p1 GENE.GHVR01028445.1~~GHVR01028445.1.p1  ORF type:complete len:135 (+),score=7.06 GHVR01028445.1:117-521(+)
MTGSEDCTIRQTRSRSGNTLPVDLTNLDRLAEGSTTNEADRTNVADRTATHATCTQSRTVPTLQHSGVEDLTGLTESEHQEFIRKTLQENKSTYDARTRLEAEDHDNYLKLKKDLCVDLGVTLQRTFTPSFNQI